MKPNQPPQAQLTELLPCPFCGSSRIDRDNYIRDGREVICRDCSASMSSYNPDADRKSADKWNRRLPVIQGTATETAEGYEHVFNEHKGGMFPKVAEPVAAPLSPEKA